MTERSHIFEDVTVNKQRINLIYKVLLIISVLIFITLLIKDYVTVYKFGSSPFYLYVWARGIELLFVVLVLNILEKILAGVIK